MNSHSHPHVDSQTHVFSSTQTHKPKATKIHTPRATHMEKSIHTDNAARYIYLQKLTSTSHELKPQHRDDLLTYTLRQTSCQVAFSNIHTSAELMLTHTYPYHFLSKQVCEQLLT